jgi:hypothetical protein
VIAPDWANLAIDERKAVNLRIGALRGLTAIGEPARGVSMRIRNLLRQRPMQGPAFETLKSMRDPIVLPRLANCSLGTDASASAWPITECVDELAAFGVGARPYANLFLKFVNSANGAEQVAGLNALAAAQVKEAAPVIEQKLNSPDWRVVHEAISALGRLGAASAEPKIKDVAQRHWLPEVRAFAQKVSQALASQEHRYEPKADERGSLVWGARAAHFKELPQCHANQWIWAGAKFTKPLESDIVEHRLKRKEASWSASTTANGVVASTGRKRARSRR